MSSPSRDNREYVRKSLKSRITVVLRDSREHVGTLADVSAQGVGITGFTPCEEQTEYHLALLHLPERHNEPRLAAFDAQCVWCRRISEAHYVSGFRLLDVSEQARSLLDSD